MKTIQRINCSLCGTQFNHTRECRYDPYRCPKCGKKHTEDDEEQVRLEPLPGELEGDEVSDVTEAEGVDDDLADASPEQKKVYLINSAAGHTKIGISHKPRSRKSDLQTASPLELDLIETVNPAVGAEQYERTLHERYSEYRVRGEWFDLPDGEFSSLVSEFQNHSRKMPEAVSD